MPTLQDKIDSITKAGCCIVQDDAADSKRSILVAPASFLTEELLNRILSLTLGLTFVAIDPLRAESFLLPPMPFRQSEDNSPSCYSCSLVSVDAREGITTGISVADRIRAINILGADKPEPHALVKPGHIFPIETRSGGLLVKHALPEAALDLAKILDWGQAAFFVDILDSYGNLMSESQQLELAQNQKIPLITISELVLHRLQHESLVNRVAQAKLPNKSSINFRALAYRSNLFAGEHLALVKGEIDKGKNDTNKPILTRVQSEQTFSDVFGGPENSSRHTLKKCLDLIEQQDCGIFLYLRKPEAGALRQQLSNEPAALPSLQPQKTQLMRDYGIGAQILKDLGATNITLLTNSKRQLVGLDAFGINIVGYQTI